jgi:DNA-binding FadR family transcriptional regulator
MVARAPAPKVHPDFDSLSGPTPRTPIRIPKTAELVADEIRRAITRGDLKDGDTLQPEAQIIADFKVSRPTVREAFRILESEKLISVSRGSRGGARVHTPKADQVARYAGFVLQSKRATYADVYQARIIIEPPAARYVAENRAHDAPAILREALDRQFAAHRTEAFGWLHAQFHAKIVELTGNETLILMHGMMDGIIGRYQSAVHVPREKSTPEGRKTSRAGARSQEKLIDLIAAGDGEATEVHWRKHMESSTRVWLSGGRGEAVVDWAD